MGQITLEKVLSEAQELSTNDQHFLRSWLDTKLHGQENFKSIEDIAREQGKRPIVNFQELLGPDPEGDDDDDVDEFLNELREWRKDETLRELD